MNSFISFRKHLRMKIFVLVLFIAGFCFSGTTKAGDWPQFRGPNRDGVCSETGLLKSWPEGGPKLAWEIAGLGIGYSSVSISGGKLYTMGDMTVGSEEAQWVIAVDLATRKRLWTAKVGPIHQDQRGGPRSIPTVDGDLVYAIGTDGNVVCVDAGTGKVRWSKHLQKDLGGGSNPTWKFSESPLIDGDKLLCTPGGHKTVMAALDKKTGDVLWTCPMSDIGAKGRDEAGYSSIIISNGAGVKQYVQLTNEGLVSISADGKFLWGYNNIANRVANIPMPIVYEDYVFCSTGYNSGAALLKLAPAENGVGVEEIYFVNPRDFQNTHGGFVKIGDYVYGGQGHNRGNPTCLDIRTGKVMWQQKQPGGGSACVLYADGNLIFRYEDGMVALVEANPQAYNLKSTFKLPEREGAIRECWAYPVISDGMLYLRHADVLFVYDVKAQ